MPKVKTYPLYLIFLFAFALRLAFAFWFQRYINGETIFTNNDTTSFTNAFLNLYQYGVYTFDPTHPDASFFRPPVYPFFWGAHYILFGEAHVFEAIAVSQSLIDAASAILIYLIASKLGVRPIFALIGGILHAVNPFQLIWVPITGTEIVATFVSLLIVFFILTSQLSARRLFWLGLLIGSAVLLRQYLGIFIVIAAAWIAISTQFHPYKAIRPMAYLVLGFCMILSPWVLRNWVNFGSPYILMGETRGYYNYGPDAVAFENMFNKFEENITPYFYDAAKHGEVDLENFELDPRIKASLKEAVVLAHRCGPSFLEARKERSFVFEDRNKECEANVIDAFERTRLAYRANVGLFRYNATRLDALSKAFFKSTLNSKKFSNSYIDIIVKICFYVRTFVIISAFLSICIVNWNSFIVISYPLFMYIYIPVITIHTEIRYLIQADAILLALFALTFDQLWRRLEFRHDD